MSTRSDRSSAAEPDPSALAWKRAQVTGEEWLVPVPAACGAEFDEIARAARGHPGPLATLDPGRLELPACAVVMAKMRTLLLDGPGFAVLDRIPVEQYRREEGQAIGWVLANLIGRIVAQKRDGTPPVRRPGHRHGGRARRAPLDHQSGAGVPYRRRLAAADPELHRPPRMLHP